MRDAYCNTLFCSLIFTCDLQKLLSLDDDHEDSNDSCKKHELLHFSFHFIIIMFHHKSNSNFHYGISHQGRERNCMLLNPVQNKLRNFVAI